MFTGSKLLATLESENTTDTLQVRALDWRETAVTAVRAVVAWSARINYTNLAGD